MFLDGELKRLCNGLLHCTDFGRGFCQVGIAYEGGQVRGDGGHSPLVGWTPSSAELLRGDGAAPRSPRPELR